MKKVKYIEEDKCPLCGNTEIILNDDSEEDNTCLRSLLCYNCRATWDQLYILKFSGIENIQDKDGNKYEVS